MHEVFSITRAVQQRRFKEKKSGALFLPRLQELVNLPRSLIVLSFFILSKLESIIKQFSPLNRFFVLLRARSAGYTISNNTRVQFLL